MFHVCFWLYTRRSDHFRILKKRNIVASFKLWHPLNNVICLGFLDQYDILQQNMMLTLNEFKHMGYDTITKKNDSIQEIYTIIVQLC